MWMKCLPNLMQNTVSFKNLQAYLRDIAGFVPDHHNKANTTVN